MTSEVVPFGKYKGAPVEVLAADKEYCEWLGAQSWFRQRYAQIFNVIVNYGHAPQDSPEHNEMQAQFLDTSYCIALAELLEGSLLMDCKVWGPRFEHEGWDATYRVTSRRLYAPTSNFESGISIAVECKPTLGDDFPNVLRQIGSRPRHGVPVVLVRRAQFESVSWADVKGIYAANDKLLVMEDVVATRAEERRAWAEIAALAEDAR